MGNRNQDRKLRKYNNLGFLNSHMRVSQRVFDQLARVNRYRKIPQILKQINIINYDNRVVPKYKI